MNIILCSGDQIRGHEIIIAEGKSIDMTKEDLLNKVHNVNYYGKTWYQEDEVKAAMDEWAKTRAISFSDWVQENEYIIPEGYGSYVKRDANRVKYDRSEFIKPEVLFEIFNKNQSLG